MNRGRPKKEINEEQVRILAGKLWSIEQIAAFFRVDRKTIERNFGAIVEEAKHEGRTKIIDYQWKRCEEGSDKMIIHMAKHHLAQHDRQEIDLHHTEGKVVEYEEIDGTKRIIEVIKTGKKE